MNSSNVYLSQLSINDANPRTITDEKFEKLTNSLLSLPKMLELRPIVYGKGGKALGGNMRLRALVAISQMSEDELTSRLEKIRDVKKKTAKEREKLRSFWLKWLKQPTAPAVNAESLTAAEQKEFIIKDNGDFGQWDYDMLANEWEVEELSDWGVDIPSFDEGGSGTSHKNVSEQEMTDEEMNKVPSRVKEGEIWQLGEHRLMCGDCTKPEVVKDLLDGNAADLWLTDPPYNVNYEGGTKEKLTIANDNKSDADFLKFLVDSYSAANENMKKGAAFYIWHADSNGFAFRDAVVKVGWELRETLI